MSTLRTDNLQTTDGLNNVAVEDLASINQRTIYVGSVAELEALSLPVGTNVYLTAEGRAGSFVVKAGPPPSDPQKGIYISLVNGNHAMRRFDGITGNGGVNVRWFGALGDGVTDDTTAIQAAINTGHPIVYVDDGDFLFSELTIGADSHRGGYTEIRGNVFDNGSGGAGQSSRLICTGLGITCERSPTFRRLRLSHANGAYDESTFSFTGSSSSLIKLKFNALFEDVRFLYCFSGIEITEDNVGPYYIALNRVTFDRCDRAITNNFGKVYNLSAINIKTAYTNTIFGGKTFEALQVIGGSLEGWQSVCSNVSSATYTNVYFETRNINAVHANVLSSGGKIALQGCWVSQKNWVTFVRGPAAGEASLVSSVGNKFIAKTGTADSSVVFDLTNIGSAYLKGDYLAPDQDVNAQYVVVSNVKSNMEITYPSTPENHVDSRYSGVLLGGERLMRWTGGASVAGNSSESLIDKRIRPYSTNITVSIGDPALSIEVDRGDGVYLTILQGGASAQAITLPIGATDIRIVNSSAGDLTFTMFEH